MRAAPRSIVIVLTLLLTTIPLVGVEASHDNETRLTTTLPSGTWVNDTLVINGSTTVPASNAVWYLYDVTNPWSEWDVVRSGEYFSEVTPIDDGLWVWSITIDVQGLNCTCWLEVSQPDGLYRVILNRLVFIGDGPHAPVLSPDHDTSIILDEPVLLSAHAYLAVGEYSQSQLSLSYCSAPNGACDGDTMNTSRNLSWNGDLATFSIDANELNLEDGTWQFTYRLVDEFLRESPEVTVWVYVDRTDPEAVLNAPDNATEDDTIVIDGSQSRDGIWGSQLQAIWYVTNPDGEVRIAEQNETVGMVLLLEPELAGDYTVRIDVVDMVGRRSSATTNISVSNIQPELMLYTDTIDIADFDDWEIEEGESIEIDSVISDSDYDLESISIDWYLDGELFSNNQSVTISDLDAGYHQLRVVVTDNDGSVTEQNIGINVESVESEVEGEFNPLAIGLIIAIVMVLILFVQRFNGKETQSTSLPKWKKHDSVDKQTDGFDESTMWTEPEEESEGKD